MQRKRNAASAHGKADRTKAADAAKAKLDAKEAEEAQARFNAEVEKNRLKGEAVAKKRAEAGGRRGSSQGGTRGRAGSNGGSSRSRGCGVTDLPIKKSDSEHCRIFVYISAMYVGYVGQMLPVTVC